MGQVSKNSRVGSSTHKFLCPCGGEIKMKTVFANGKKKNYAECSFTAENAAAISCEQVLGSYIVRFTRFLKKI